MREHLRIFYAAGPGNVIGTYHHWKQHRDDPSQLAVTYSGQFYQVVQDMGAKAYVIASCPIRNRVRDGRFHIEHWPIPFEEHSGMLYHLGQLIYGIRLLAAAVLFRADVAVVCGGTHWFMLSMMSMLGIRVVPSLHCMLWRAGSKRRQYRYVWLRRFVRKMDGAFFRNRAIAILSVSSQLTAQVRSLQDPAQSESLPPIHTFTPIYRRGTFDHIAPPPVSRKPFRVLYIGRVERNKGVFDLSRVALRLTNAGHTDIEFDLCGSGNAMSELSRCIAATGIASRFRLHGHCNQKQLAKFLSKSHVVIAPTQCDFLEGFNKVVVEGVLASRPVITSSICPSLALVRDAALEVRPDDVQGYGDAILQLRDDPALYQQMVRNAAVLSPQFYDETASWGEALQNVLRTIQPPPAETYPRAFRTMRPRESHFERTGWPARMSFTGIVVAMVLGVLATLLGPNAGEHNAKAADLGLSKARSSHGSPEPASLAMHHAGTGHSGQISLTAEP